MLTWTSVFIKVFQGSSSALKAAHFFRVPAVLQWMQWIWLLYLIHHFQCRVTYWAPVEMLLELVAWYKLPIDIHTRFCHARPGRYTARRYKGNGIQQCKIWLVYFARRYKGKEMPDLRRSSSFCIVENSASWLWRSSFPPKLSAAVATTRHSLLHKKVRFL
jgi:hypothetical protein